MAKGNCGKCAAAKNANKATYNSVIPEQGQLPSSADKMYYIYVTENKTLVSKLYGVPYRLHMGKPIPVFETDLVSWVKGRELMGVTFVHEYQEKEFLGEHADIKKEHYA